MTKTVTKKPRGNAFTRSFANYVPQLVDQIAAQLPAQAAALAIGAATGGTGYAPAAKLLGAASSYKQSYDVMKGSAYDNLVSLGVDETRANQLSTNEAFLSSLIEMGEFIISFKALGFDKLLGAVSKLGIDATSKLVAKAGKETLVKGALQKSVECVKGLRN